jgi:hypothetical protein
VVNDNAVPVQGAPATSDGDETSVLTVIVLDGAERLPPVIATTLNW